jgi:hypothetical protein
MGLRLLEHSEDMAKAEAGGTVLAFLLIDYVLRFLFLRCKLFHPWHVWFSFFISTIDDPGAMEQLARCDYFFVSSKITN